MVARRKADMDVFEVIRTRRSMRKFKDTPVPRAVAERLIELGSWAPSNCDTQGWRFIIVDDKDLKKKIVDHGASAVVRTAPLGILVCYDWRTDNLEYQDWLQSAAAAIQNMQLGAHELGLGSCWICHLPGQKRLQAIFGIPSHYRPVAYLALGYPGHGPKAVPRHHPISELYDYNRFPKPTDCQCRIPGRAHLAFRRVIRRIYYGLPLQVKKRINPFVDSRFVRKFDN